MRKRAGLLTRKDSTVFTVAVARLATTTTYIVHWQWNKQLDTGRYKKTWVTRFDNDDTKRSTLKKIYIHIYIYICLWRGVYSMQIWTSKSLKSAASCVDVRACNWASCGWGRCETNGLVVYFVCFLQSCRRWKSSKIFKAYICQQILGKNGLERSNSKRLSDATGKKLPCWPLLQWRSATAGPAGKPMFFFAKLSSWNKGVSGYQYKNPSWLSGEKKAWNKYLVG